jgi:hypothetical protein
MPRDGLGVAIEQLTDAEADGLLELGAGRRHLDVESQRRPLAHDLACG